MPEALICQHCGSTSFEDLNPERMKCAHCGSIFKKNHGEPAVIISKGAKVMIGKSANVEIMGDLEIQEGANLDIQGQVVIHDKKDPNKKPE